MTEIETILTTLAQKIIINNKRHLNQCIEDFNNLLSINPEIALQNLSMLSKEDQQTASTIIEAMITSIGWRQPDGGIDVTKIYVDICCGRGAILAYLYSHYGVPKENLFGIELKSENVLLCNRLGFNVVQGNALNSETYIELKNKIKNIKGEYMEITRILMNPPYAGDLHLKILNSARENCPLAEIANLSPVAPLYEYFAYGRPHSLANLKNYHIKSIIPEQEAEKSFNLSNIGSDLGIWVSIPKVTSTDDELMAELFGEKTALIKKLWLTFLPTEKLAKHTLKYSQCSKQNVIKFVYGLSLSNHGLTTPSSFNITSLNITTASTGIESSHTRYVEFDTKDEQQIIHNFYCSNIMRFFYKEVIRGRCDYNLIPWFEPTVIGKDADTFLINFCGLTADELNLINTTMKPYTINLDEAD